MFNPKVSIIIPVYNGSNYIRQSIESALNQDYDNLEIIVVNDGSNDNGKTEKIAFEYEGRIKYYHKDNGGVSSALNFGINKMTGEYFSWLSHDDIYERCKISEQIKCISSNFNERTIVMSNSIFIDKNSKYIGKGVRRYKKPEYKSNQMFKKLLNNHSINGCTLLIPKSALLEANLFDENLKYIQDWKMWIKLSLLHYNFLVVKDNLVKMRIHTEQQTLTLKNKLQYETNLVINELAHFLMIDGMSNKDKLIQVIYFAIRKKSKIIYSFLINEMKTHKLLSIYDYVLLMMYFPVGTTVNIIKQILRLFINTIRRIGT